MKRSKSFIRRDDLIIVLLLCLAVWIILSLLFDFYYDLNDDVLIKDIISGVYTGIPDAHNNQIMYPLSWLLSCLYALTPQVPWFGVFEIGAIIISLILISIVLIKDCRSKKKIVVRLFVLYSLLIGCYLWEVVIIQYTVVSGMLATVAAVWLYSTPQDKSGKDYLIYNLPTFIFCFLSFNLRSEMFLLMTPILSMVGIAKWSREKRVLSKDSFVKYLGSVGIIVALIVITIVADSFAYSSKEWKEFRQFFDARTRVYDITGIPQYSENRAFYDDNGISPEQIDRLLSYNWARDDSIDTNMLNAIADYVESGNAFTNRSPIGIKGAIGEYLRNAFYIKSKSSDMDILYKDDATQHLPMNLSVLALYVCILIKTLSTPNKLRNLAIFVIMLILRSIPWIYIYTTQRVITRITHPLYMLEIMALLIMIFTVDNNNSNRIINTILALIVVAALVQIPFYVREITYKQQLREESNERFKEWENVAISNPDTYYYVDVYSTVSFTEKIFTQAVSKANWQLDGGWIAKSPLDRYKREMIDYERACVATWSDESGWTISNIE